MRADTGTTLVREVLSEDGEILSRFDFEQLGLAPELCHALRRAHEANYGHTSLETQRQAWRCIRKFAQCLREKGRADEMPLRNGELQRFRTWLAGTGLATSTAQSVLNIVVVVVTWCSRNVPEVIGEKFNLQVNPFVRNTPTVRQALHEAEVKAVLAACYEEIREIELRLGTGRRLLEGDFRNDEESALSKLLTELLALGGGLFPSQKQLSRSRDRLSQRVSEAGGLRRLARLLWIAPDTMFPYYLAIQVQTSGNPMALLELERDCVRPHPLRDDVVRLEWDKRRAKARQSVEFPAGKEWSAPALVARLAALNGTLVPRAKPRQQQRLFLCLRGSPKSVGTPCMQLMHLLLNVFIKKHQLPVFDFRDMRRSGAIAHHQAGGSLTAAQRRLNHRSVRTTQKYTGLSDRAAEHDLTISRFQGALVNLSKSAGAEKRAKTSAVPASAAETVFGFICKDPLAGTAAGSQVGHACLQFHQCATCPGAIIPVDDVQVVARLMRTEAHLVAERDRAVQEGWWKRFESLYEPTLQILQREILPMASAGVRAAASNLHVGPRHFPLE